MSETVLGAFAVALAAFLVFHVLARRSIPAADVAGGPVSARREEPAGGSREHTPLLDTSMWQSATAPDLTTAEELLDLAEQEGYRERELIVLGNSTFLVRWRDRAERQCREPS